MPILKGGDRKKNAKRAEQFKNATLAGFFAFFILYKKIGLLNRLMFCLFASQGLVYFAKSNFYRMCVDELTYEMTLTG